MFSAEPYLLLVRRQHPPSRHYYGDCDENKWVEVDTDEETGPGVLSGTGQQLAGKRCKEWLRGHDL